MHICFDSPEHISAKRPAEKGSDSKQNPAGRGGCEH